MKALIDARRSVVHLAPTASSHRLARFTIVLRNARRRTVRVRVVLARGCLRRIPRGTPLRVETPCATTRATNVTRTNTCTLIRRRRTVVCDETTVARQRERVGARVLRATPSAPVKITPITLGDRRTQRRARGVIETGRTSAASRASC